MDAETDRRVGAFLKNKWKHGSCPVCQTDGWETATDIAEMATSEIYATDPRASGATYPMFPIFCSNCGYTLLFNALIAGLVGPEADEAEAKAAEQTS
jgi:predicted nucleic-acid-binding Zn-ribbon protein